MQRAGKKRSIFHSRVQPHPGMEYKMNPLPQYLPPAAGTNKLAGKQCIITGGDSGIGRAIAFAFANEGADVAIVYLNEHRDAEQTAKEIMERYSRKCLLIPADLSKEKKCLNAVKKVMKEFTSLDVLVNNSGIQYESDDITQLTSEQLIHTFSVNIFSMFWMSKAALEYMDEGSTIINSGSVVAFRGSGGLLDYSASKGAVVAFTRSLSANLLPKGIRVNGVAPGPVWTPLVVTGSPQSKIKTFGTDSPIGRPAQPFEVAPAYVFLASNDAVFISGQFIHPNGGEVVNG